MIIPISLSNNNFFLQQIQSFSILSDYFIEIILLHYDKELIPIQLEKTIKYQNGNYL
jgi:hypothetical protein